MAARARLTLLVAALAAALGCVQDDGTRFNPIADLTSVSEDEERELGLEFDRQLRDHVLVVDDPVIAGFINDLGQEIVRTLEPQPFIYRFRVIQDPSLNAFAVPGGYVYFHSGTILAAGGIDEIAGVMGHEIAHVKAHHYARMKQKTQVPDLLVGLAGMAAAVAVGDSTPMLAAQAANVAVQLRFSREFENEADRLGAVFMTRAGYEPDGITKFFRRLVREEQRVGVTRPPPYLYSHPDVKDRIATVEIQARELRPTRAPDPTVAAELPEVQGRLAYLLETKRRQIPPPDPPERPEVIDPLLQRADDLVQEGRLDEALLVLTRAEAREPRDPRPSFQIGRLLAAQDRHHVAIAALRRTVLLDPSRALVFYQLGLSYEAVGDRHLAVYAFEQASRRAGATSALRQRAEWQIETLIFPVLRDASFAAAGVTPGHGEPAVVFPEETRRVTWQARLASRYDDYLEKLSVRLRDPAGKAVASTPLRRASGPWVGAELHLPPYSPQGRWTAEALYEGDVLHRQSFRLQPAAR
jgi:predicted Zn-dependent protease